MRATALTVVVALALGGCATSGSLATGGEPLMPLVSKAKLDPCPHWPPAAAGNHDQLFISVMHDQLKEVPPITHPVAVQPNGDLDLSNAGFMNPVDVYFTIDTSTLPGATFLNNPFNSIWIVFDPDHNQPDPVHQAYPGSFSDVCEENNQNVLLFTMSNIKSLRYRYKLVINVGGKYIKLDPQIINH